MKQLSLSILAPNGIAAILGLLVVVLASCAASEELDWTPPDVVPENPVLANMLSRWSRGEQGVVVGTETVDGVKRGADEFWEGVLALDTAGLIAEAKPVDGNALAYFPPFVILFPDESFRAVVAANDHPLASMMLRRLDRGASVVLIPDFRDPSLPTLRTTYLIFILDVSAGEDAGICHSREVIRAVYTGTVNENALDDCLGQGEGPPG